MTKLWTCPECFGNFMDEFPPTCPFCNKQNICPTCGHNKDKMKEFIELSKEIREHLAHGAQSHQINCFYIWSKILSSLELETKK